MAGGHSIRHPSPHSLVAWLTAQEGQRGAGGSGNVLEGDGDVQSEGYLQCRRGTCNSSWCCARGGLIIWGVLQCLGGLAMCRTLQFKEGYCFTVGVLLCMFGGSSIRGAPSWRGPSMLDLCWRRRSCNSWMLLKCMERSCHAKGSFSANRVVLHFTGALAVLGAVLS